MRNLNHSRSLTAGRSSMQAAECARSRKVAGWLPAHQRAAFPQSQRDCVIKPRVARHELPWVDRPRRFQSQRGCVTLLWFSRNPVGVVPIRAGLPRVARSSQPWALRRNPFGIQLWNFRRALGPSVALLLATAATALADVHYVDVNSTNATPPYTNWTTAAASVQAAVDAAVAGEEIVVTNGTYGPVGVDKPLNVRSVNGPQFTTIHGYSGRCVYLANNATLSGFTLTGGHFEGGGVWCESTDAVVSNCVITGNRVSVVASVQNSFYGGGAYGGTLNNCTLSNNSISAVSSGGRYSNPGAFGGGAYSCTLNNCMLRGNSVSATSSRDGEASALGGGAGFCTLNNCTLQANSASVSRSGTPDLETRLSVRGGGAYGCLLNNCTLSANSVADHFTHWASGGGALGALNNCVSFRNTGDFGCEDCGSPGSLVGNNWFGDPLFVDLATGNLRLQPNSPCINAGNNSYVTNATDLDGNPRIAGGTVDIGAYEFQSPVSMISYAWLQQYGLPINSSTDTADPDGDGVDNYHEWLADTDPTNPFSLPPLLTLIPYGANVILTWPTNAVGFTLQSTTNLVSPEDWSANSPAPVVIGGQNVVINPISGPRQFYRLSQ